MGILFVLLLPPAILGWMFYVGERKQRKFLEQKNEGFKNALLAYMMYRYRDLARIEKLENESKVCEFGRGK